MYIVYLIQYQKIQNNCQIFWKWLKQALFYTFSMVSSVASALILLPFLSLAQHESGTRKAIFWSVTVYSKNLSSQCKFTAETEAREDKINKNSIGGVIVSMLSPGAMYRGFDHLTGQIKDYEIGICCFSANHATLRSNIKTWLALN